MMDSKAVRASELTGTECQVRHYGVYSARVVANNDPLGKNRVQLQVPQILGTAISNWAIPAGVASLPGAGTTVLAMFLGGDVNRPVYLLIGVG